MVIAVLRLEFRLKRATGPWRKRRLMRNFLQQIHRRFNVSVAEVEKHEHPLESVFAVVAVAPTRRELRAMLDEVARACARHPKVELTDRSVDEV